MASFTANYTTINQLATAIDKIKEKLIGEQSVSRVVIGGRHGYNNRTKGHKGETITKG